MAKQTTLNSVEEVIEDFRNGKIVIVVDDEDRENEGDFIVAAEKITPEIVNFMLKEGRGVLCAPLSEERCAQLELNMMEENNTSLLGTPFTVTADLLGHGCTTGVSIHDRAATIRALADPATRPSDLGRPGHINPLRARQKGVLRQKSNGVEHVALTKGEWSEEEPVLIRVHSSCATGDIFGSYRCDCGEQLHRAMQMIQREGKGAVVYLNQEGRGIGLCNKIHAYKLQDEGLDTVDANLRLGFKADERDYGVGASIIRELGIRHMRLMTNNPLKRAGLEGYGLKIDEIVPIVIAPNKYNEHYLETKQERMHHTLGLEKK